MELFFKSGGLHVTVSKCLDSRVIVFCYTSQLKYVLPLKENMSCVIHVGQNSLTP